MSAGAALIGGQIIQGVGAYGSAMSRAEAYRFEAAAKRARAAQVEISAEHEIELASRRYERTKGAQIAAIGRSGVELKGSPLAELETAAANHVSNIRAIRAAAEYRKSTILTEGLFSEQLASSAENEAFLGMLGAGIGAASKNPYSYDSKISGDESTYIGSPVTEAGGSASSLRRKGVFGD